MGAEMDLSGAQFINVDGLRIRYLRSEGEGVPVVLTSPWPESLYAFSRIWPKLVDAAPLLAFDLPGFGQSEGRADLMSPMAMGDFLPRVLAALELGPVHAVGPDVGTSALLFAARCRPGLFRSLVIGSGAIDVARVGERLKDIMNAPSTANFEHNDGAALAIGAIERMMKRHPDPLVLQDYAASSAGRRFAEATSYVRSYPRDLPALQPMLPDIATPVLSIWGAHDPIVLPSNADVLDEALPRTRSLILDSSHFVWEDQAEAYATAVRDWICGGYEAAHGRSGSQAD